MRLTLSAMSARGTVTTTSLDELLDLVKRALRGACVDRRNPTGMARAPSLQEIERLSAAHFADDDAIRTQAQCAAHELGHRRDAGLCAWAAWSAEAHCSSTYPPSRITRSPWQRFPEEGIRKGGFSGGCARRQSRCSAVEDRLAKRDLLRPP